MLFFDGRATLQVNVMKTLPRSTTLRDQGSGTVAETRFYREFKAQYHMCKLNQDCQLVLLLTHKVVGGVWSKLHAAPGARHGVRLIVRGQRLGTPIHSGLVLCKDDFLSSIEENCVACLDHEEEDAKEWCTIRLSMQIRPLPGADLWGLT